MSDSADTHGEAQEGDAASAKGLPHISLGENHSVTPVTVNDKTEDTGEGDASKSPSGSADNPAESVEPNTNATNNSLGQECQNEDKTQSEPGPDSEAPTEDKAPNTEGDVDEEAAEHFQQQLNQKRGRTKAFYYKGTENSDSSQPGHRPTLSQVIAASNQANAPPPPPNPANDPIPKDSATCTCNNPFVADSRPKLPKTLSAKKLKAQAPPEKVQGESKRFWIGYAETIGRRPNMEDMIVIQGQFRNKPDEDYIALFDGHGGKAAAVYAAAHHPAILAECLKKHKDNPVKSLRESFEVVNKKMKKENLAGGCTALVVLFIGNNGYVANAGDSRAVLCRDNEVFRITVDHKPNDPKEEDRIKKLGGNITATTYKDGSVTYRVEGQLSVARCLGDFHLNPFVTPDPEVSGPFNLFQENKNQVIVLACDGVWDVVSDEAAIQVVKSIEDPGAASEALRDMAFKKGSGDNISVITMRFPPPSLAPTLHLAGVSDAPSSTTSHAQPEPSSSTTHTTTTTTTTDTAATATDTATTTTTAPEITITAPEDPTSSPAATATSPSTETSSVPEASTTSSDHPAPQTEAPEDSAAPNSSNENTPSQPSNSTHTDAPSTESVPAAAPPQPSTLPLESPSC